MTAPEIFDRLDGQHPNADTELDFRTPFELLAATILSAQCTDARVNQVTPTLFAQYPDARAMAAATPEALEPLIQTTGFFRVKARNLQGMAEQLVRLHGGEVPSDMDALTSLPGVGRKTANVVLGHALGIPGWPVDRHVLRVAERIGLIHTEDAVAAERALCALLPQARWTRASDTLILHGRRICKPKPMCDSCAIRTGCAYFASLGAKVPSARPTKKPATKGATARAATPTKKPRT